jgi:hypothetical protein
MILRLSIFFLVLSVGYQAPVRAALIANWSGNGNTDESIAGRNGTLLNGAGYGSGLIGQGFQLDGINDYVTVADDDVWSFGNNAFSIAVWANFDSVNQGAVGQLPNVFVAHDQGSGQQNKWVFFHDGNGQLAFHINDASAGLDFLTAPLSFSPVIGNWHHFAISRSGSTYTFYADGNSLGTASTSRTIGNANAMLTIGQAEGLGYFDGRLDEIQIYNEALSATQIQQLAAVPEPSSLLILVATLPAVMACRNRRVANG